MRLHVHTSHARAHRRMPRQVGRLVKQTQFVHQTTFSALITTKCVPAPRPHNRATLAQEQCGLLVTHTHPQLPSKAHTTTAVQPTQLARCNECVQCVSCVFVCACKVRVLTLRCPPPLVSSTSSEPSSGRGTTAEPTPSPTTSLAPRHGRSTETLKHFGDEFQFGESDESVY